VFCEKKEKATSKFRGSESPGEIRDLSSANRKFELLKKAEGEDKGLDDQTEGAAARKGRKGNHIKARVDFLERMAITIAGGGKRSKSWEAMGEKCSYWGNDGKVLRRSSSRGGQNEDRRVSRWKDNLREGGGSKEGGEDYTGPKTPLRWYIPQTPQSKHTLAFESRWQAREERDVNRGLGATVLVSGPGGEVMGIFDAARGRAQEGGGATVAVRGPEANKAVRLGTDQIRS